MIIYSKEIKIKVNMVFLVKNNVWLIVEWVVSERSCDRRACYAVKCALSDAVRDVVMQWCNDLCLKLIILKSMIGYWGPFLSFENIELILRILVNNIYLDEFILTNIIMLRLSNDKIIFKTSRVTSSILIGIFINGKSKNVLPFLRDL